MDRYLDMLRSRVLPATLTALGVAFVTAGLIMLTGPVEAQPGGTPSPTTGAAASPSGPLSTNPASVGPNPTIPPDRVATRVRVAALGIDLPVIAQPGPTVPCDVAMYLGEMRQPGADRATYIYAHAQRGMFLPILDASRVQSGAGMLGDIIEVYTSDDMVFLYEVSKIVLHVPYDTGLEDALAATSDELWLQTSEGIGPTFPKLQIVAKPLSSGPTDPAKAHPSPKPRACH